MDEPTRNRLKGRKILFDRNSKVLEELSQIILTSSKRVLIVWSFHFVEELLNSINELNPDEKRLNEAYQVVKDWAKGKVLMPEAKKAILACHQLAKVAGNEVLTSYYHAIGQGLSVVHTEKHALGLPIYELSGIVKSDPKNYAEQVKKKVEEYISVLNELNALPSIEYLQFAHFIK
ncbi:MAG: putative immunity protein [Candidatus Izemoplasmatales bacterium]